MQSLYLCWSYSQYNIGHYSSYNQLASHQAIIDTKQYSMGGERHVLHQLIHHGISSFLSLVLSGSCTYC